MNHENENSKRPDTAPESEALETAASEAETPETEAGTPENAAEASVEAAAPEAAEDGSKKEKKAKAVGFFMQRRIHLSKVSHTFHMVFHAKSPFSA